ncbi:MAG: ABC transporter permease [Acetatifactor sp.]
MWNIIKAQNYQIKRDNVIWYGYIFTFVLLILIPFSNGVTWKDLDGSVYAVMTMGELTFLAPLLTLVLTARICGRDYSDKTINYEVLAGHSRKNIYFARVILSLWWSVSGVAILTLLPILVITILRGWGYTADAVNLAVRGFFVLFPILRIVCVWVLLTFLVKNAGKAMVLGYALYEAIMVVALVLQESFHITFTIQFAFSNLAALMELKNYMLEYVDGSDVFVMETTLEPSLAVQTVAVSLVAGAICLALGYLEFRRSDMP